MTSSEPKFIGKRITVRRSKQEMVIEIGQQVERWQEALLLAWIAAWTFCGGVFLYYSFTSADQKQQIFFIMLSSVWLYFFVRITKVFFWRKWGKEVLTFSSGILTLKNAFGSRGRSESFSYHNIFKLGLVRSESTNFLAFLDQSFWIIGGDKIGFSYSGSKVRLGKQLELRDAELLVRVIEGAMREYKEK